MVATSARAIAAAAPADPEAARRQPAPLIRYSEAAAGANLNLEVSSMTLTIIRGWRR